MKIEVSIDDGNELDLKVIKLLDKYDIKGVFYIPIESWGFENLEKYKGHEVSGHTWTHPQDLKKLSDYDLKYETANAKKCLEAKLDKRIAKFCFPRGRYDDRVIEAVLMAGFAEARTTQVSFIRDTDDFLKHTAVHMYARDEYEGNDWLEIAKGMLKSPTSEILRFWGHSRELEVYREWDKFELLLREINETKHS